MSDHAFVLLLLVLQGLTGIAIVLAAIVFYWIIGRIKTLTAEQEAGPTLQ